MQHSLSKPEVTAVLAAAAVIFVIFWILVRGFLIRLPYEKQEFYQKKER